MHISQKIILSLLISLLPIVGSAQKSDTKIERGRIHTDCRHKGIHRVRTYDVFSADIPPSFEGFRLAYISDTHYPSRFTSRTLESLKNILLELSPDAILLGGDYQEGCDYVEPLFQAIMASAPSFGAYAVLGNNDFERCTELIKNQMSASGITLIEDTLAQICHSDEKIYICGAHNTFRTRESSPSPTRFVNDSDFAILLTHTPDYAEDVDISGADLTLAGHTHGGQVTFFGLFAPKTASHYGQQFRTGLNFNSAGLPVITSNGIGTSRVALRFCAPSEIFIITLHSDK